MSKRVCDNVTTVDAAKKGVGVRPVDGNIRQDEVSEVNTAPGGVVISEDGVRNMEMIHPAAKEGAGVAVTVLLKMQQVNGDVNTAYTYKSAKGNQIIDFKKVSVVIKYSYSLFECS